MVNNGTQEQVSLMKAQGAAPALWYDSGARGKEAAPAYMSDEGQRSQEYDLSTQELDLNDLAEANIGSKSIQDSIAELQQMITACGDAEDFLNYGAEKHQQSPSTQLSQITPISKSDPAAHLRQQCQVMREEVNHLVKAKQEMEMELRQNVQKLQERIESQYTEKASLTERLLDAKQKFGAKR